MPNSLKVIKACTLYNSQSAGVAFNVNDIVQPTSNFYSQFLQLGSTFAIDSGIAGLSAPPLTSSLSSVPAWFPLNAKNTFNNSKSVYNLKGSNTRRTRAGLAKAQAGTNFCRIGIFGDSKSDQYNGSNTGNGGYDTTNTKWPWKMRDQVRLDRNIPLGGTGFVKCYHAGVYDPRWTFSGAGWTNYVAGFYSFTSTAGNYATFSTIATGEAGTVFELYYFDYQNCTITISVDGASSGVGFATVNCGGTSTGKMIALTGLANSTHSVRITCTANPYMFLFGACIRQAAGLMIDNYAINGGGTPSFTSFTAAVNYGGIIAPYTSAIIFALGVNDLNPGGSFNITRDQVVANITSIAGNYPYADVWLVAEDMAAVYTTATWNPYLTLLYTLADTLDCPLIDINHRLGDNTIETANGMMYDSTHQNVAGDIEWATVIAEAIAA